jgi:hypothetical protein
VAGLPAIAFNSTDLISDICKGTGKGNSLISQDAVAVRIPALICYFKAYCAAFGVNHGKHGNVDTAIFTAVKDLERRLAA